MAKKSTKKIIKNVVEEKIVEPIKEVAKKVIKAKNFVTTDAILAEKLQDTFNIISAKNNKDGVKEFTFACSTEEAEKLIGE